MLSGRREWERANILVEPRNDLIENAAHPKVWANHLVPVLAKALVRRGL